MPLTEDDRAALSAYLDGELDAATSHRLEVRLGVDPELRHEFEVLKQTWSLLDYLPAAAVSTNFTSRTVERMTLERRGGGRTEWLRRWVRRLRPATLAWAAAVLLALGVGYAMGARLVPVPVPDAAPEHDEMLVRHLRIIERWSLYQHAEDVDFLKDLDQPELFGDEHGS
jgi:anti-sigma factor RsiW